MILPTNRQIRKIGKYLRPDIQRTFHCMVEGREYFLCRSILNNPLRERYEKYDYMINNLGLIPQSIHLTNCASEEDEKIGTNTIYRPPNAKSCINAAT